MANFTYRNARKMADTIRFSVTNPLVSIQQKQIYSSLLCIIFQNVCIIVQTVMPYVFILFTSFTGNTLTNIHKADFSSTAYIDSFCNLYFFSFFLTDSFILCLISSCKGYFICLFICLPLFLPLSSHSYSFEASIK